MGKTKMNYDMLGGDPSNNIQPVTNPPTHKMVPLLNPLEVMKDYLLLKFELGDWHGVADAANDIREMLAKDKR